MKKLSTRSKYNIIALFIFILSVFLFKKLFTNKLYFIFHTILYLKMFFYVNRLFKGHRDSLNSIVAGILLYIIVSSLYYPGLYIAIHYNLDLGIYLIFISILLLKNCFKTLYNKVDDFAKKH